ncbi:hypothetical protein ACM26V_00010 [Salipaludibacillus sp. HK11]|uniref:hypothetical protein n=1 Tax=Salipaludibacillus sp. HK11 TaxID=3394320 RepID=UPI0039FBEFBA
MKCVYSKNLMWSEGTRLDTQYREIFLHETGVNIETFVDKALTIISDVIQTIVDVWSGVVEAYKDMLKVNQKEMNQISIPKMEFDTIQQAIPLTDQVMDRKPMLARARSCC